MAITIIYGPPREGKTALMSHYGNLALYDDERGFETADELEAMNAGGFNYTVPEVPVVCTNYELKGNCTGVLPRVARRINPYRLGFTNRHVNVHFIEPGAVICITEGQKYFNSRMSRLYPDWQSRWMEQHGHNGYDIYIDVQRPMLIDVNIRDLAQFIEIREKRTVETHDGIKTVWEVRRIPSNAELERYLASGKKDETCFTEETIIANYDVHECYDHKMCKPKFFEGHLPEDFDTVEHEPLEETMEGYIKYLQEMDDELPKEFYKKVAA